MLTVTLTVIYDDNLGLVLEALNIKQFALCHECKSLEFTVMKVWHANEHFYLINYSGNTVYSMHSSSQIAELGHK